MAEELCPNCGTPYEPGGTFCINCGAKRVEAKKEETSEAAAGPPESKAAPPQEPADKGRKASKKKPPEEAPPSDEEVLERLEKEAGEEPAPEETKPPAPKETKPPAPEATPAPPAPAPPPAPTPPADADVGEPPPTEPKKKSRKGCCVALVVAGLLGLIVVVIGAVLYFTGALNNLGVGGGGAAYTHDFEAVTDKDFAVWQTGPETLVKPANGMLEVKNALVGVNFDPGANYKATCTVFVQTVESDSGWAGLSLRVNPKGGDRYSFEIVPATGTARIRKIAGKGEPLVLVSSRVPALKVGAPFTVTAGVSGSELTMEVNGTVVGRATDIGLIKGPMGFEVRGATAYFDDLSIETE